MIGKPSLLLISAFFLSAIITMAQPVAFSWSIKNSDNLLSKTVKYPIRISIYNDSECKRPVFIEKQYLQLKGDSIIHLIIGKGIEEFGNIDSVIWSEGFYYLSISSDTVFSNMKLLSHKMLMRIPTIVQPDNLEGVVEEKMLTNSSQIIIPHSKNTRPRKVTVDLTTSYVNTSYPADTYPIYRHYEWFDEDRDGVGNALTLSYSENTKHAFEENTNKLGEVKLYAKAFQEIEIHTSSNDVQLQMSKPIVLNNHSQTFAIKGPWKMIYLIEW